MRRLKVGYVVPPSPQFAGVELVVHEIASGLMEAFGDHVDVHVIYSTRYEDQRLKQTPYTLHVLDVDRIRGLPLKLRRVVAREKFDVVISAQVEPSVLTWAVTRGMGLPIFVAHLHGNPEVEERQGSRSTQLLFAVFRHLVSRRIAAVLAVSPTLRTYAAEKISPRSPVYFVKNPARELGGSVRRSEPNGVFRFVNLARLSHQKGLDILIRAVALARPDLPPATFTLVGSGPDEAALKELAIELGVDDLVRFAGYTADPGSFLRDADCFVLSSRWEGFPLVLLEALSFGLPLLAADCDFGPADLITEQRLGALFAVGDATALARGLVAAAGQPRDLEAEAFRRATAATYHRSAAATMHFTVLCEILARAGRPDRWMSRMPSRSTRSQATSPP